MKIVKFEQNKRMEQITKLTQNSTSDFVSSIFNLVLSISKKDENFSYSKIDELNKKIEEVEKSLETDKDIIKKSKILISDLETKIYNLKEKNEMLKIRLENVLMGKGTY